MRKGRTEWKPEHTETMLRLRAAGKGAADIAAQTGHSLRTVKYHLSDAGLKTQGNRSHWTRRDWLLHDASGLDFDMHFCR